MDKKSTPPAKAKTRKLYSMEVMQKRQKRLLSGDGKPDILPKISANLSKNDIVNRLRDMIGVTCATNSDKFHLLRRRDELMSKLRDLCSEPGTRKITQGTCPDMCPEKERYMRDVKKSVHFYECDSRGQMVHEKMVKDYSRSAADQDMPLAHELRPLGALHTTMDYLIFNIAAEMPATNQELARWYDFLWSRTRAIRKDITQQMLQNESAVDLVEKCARLHIFASFKLGFLEAELFDHKINTENLSQSMQTLRHMYEDLAKKQQFCLNEPEFRSYDIILNLTDFNVHDQVLAYRPAVRESPQVKLALDLASALQNNNFVRFFRLVRNQATFLQSCLCFQFFTLVRCSALKVICLAYHNFPLESLVRNLAFDSAKQAIAFLHVFRMELDDTDSNLINTREGRNVFMPGSEPLPNPNTVQQQFSCAWIEAKAMHSTLPQILYNDSTAAAPASGSETAQLAISSSSFSPDSHAYVNDPVMGALLEQHGGTTAAPIPSTASNKAPTIQQQRPPPPPSLKQLLLPSAFSFTKTSSSFLPPLPMQQFQPKSQETEFANTQGDQIIDRVVAQQLTMVGRNLLDGIVRTRLAQIHSNLRRNRLRQFVHHWCAFAQHRRRLRMAKQLTESFLTNIVHDQLENCAGPVYREAREMWRHQLATEFAFARGNGLLEDVLARQLYSIACRVRANQVRDIQQRLQQIRQNLYQKWLRQFTDHWLRIVRRNRLLRSITTTQQPTIANPTAAPLPPPSPPSKQQRFFYPGIKKLTPERMQEMAEQKLRQREEAEERRRRAAEEMAAAEKNGGEGEEEETIVYTAASIREMVLGGVSFSQDAYSGGGIGGLVDANSKLHLFKPGVKQLTPECMRRMAEEKMRQRELQQNGQSAEVENGQNGKRTAAPILYDGATDDHQWCYQTGPAKKRRYF